jgi:serine/threonine-protein kinase
MKKVGRYVIISELGRGAMGVVYRASDPTIDREVALKVLSLSNSTEEGTNSPQEMFMREVRAAGRLAHPSIVTIYDAFDDPVNQTSCIVMELVPGVTLEKMLDSGKPPSIEQSLDLIRQVAEALDYAHRNKVIHRDLKPANILVTDDGRAKITDFGIAKVLAREGVARTIGIMGTPSYMSPEQVRGGEIDARTDVFSLGIMIFTMLTGQKPFAGNTAAVMFKIVYEEPAVPSSVNFQLTPAHDFVVKKCLAKDRNQRYSSVRELLGDLDDLQHGRSPRSHTEAPSVAPPVEHASTGPAATLNQAAVKPQAPRMPPAATPLRADPPVPRTPPPPTVAPGGSNSPVPSYSTDPTVALPKPGPTKSVPPPPAQPAPSAQPLMGKTLVMRVPDLAAISSSPQSTTVPPAPPDSPLMGRTLPMRVPDLSAVSPTGPSSPPTTSVPPPPDPRLAQKTPSAPVRDFPAAPPPVPRAPQNVPVSRPPQNLPVPPSAPNATVRTPPPDFFPTESRPTIHADGPDVTVASPAAGPEFGMPTRLTPIDSEHAVQPGEIPGAVVAAPKSKLIPVVAGIAVMLLLLVAAALGYWKFHKPQSAQPAEQPMKAQSEIPPPDLTQVVPQPTSPGVPVEQPAAPVSPAPDATKKTVARKPKQVVAHPQPVQLPPQPAPVVVEPPKPVPSGPSPEEIAKAEAAKLAAAPRIVNVVCDFGLKEAKFTFSGGGKTLYVETLKGKKKKSGFLGIKGSYEGTFTHTLTVPAGVSTVTLHVESKDGSTDLTNTVKMPTSGGFIPTLSVQVDNEHLALSWKGTAGGL